MKKYKLTDETIVHNRRTLYRIKALKDFNGVKEGEIGGYVESEKNLSHEGNCWLYGDSKAYDDAIIKEDASLYDNAEAYGSSYITGTAVMWDNSKIGDCSILSGDAVMAGYSEVLGRSQVEGCIYGYSKIYDSWIQKESFIEGNSGIYCTNILPGTCILDDIVQKNSDYMTFIDPAFQTYITYVRKDGKWKCTGNNLKENYLEIQMIRNPEYKEYYIAVINLLNNYKSNE